MIAIVLLFRPVLFCNLRKGQQKIFFFFKVIATASIKIPRLMDDTMEIMASIFYQGENWPASSGLK